MVKLYSLWMLSSACQGRSLLVPAIGNLCSRMCFSLTSLWLMNLWLIVGKQKQILFRQEACLSYYLLYAQSFFDLAFSFSSVTSNIKHLQYYSSIPLSFTLYYPSHLVTLQHYCITLPYTVMLTFPILSHQSLVYTCSTPPIYSFCYKNFFFSSLPQSTRYTSSLYVILFYTTCTPAIQAVTYLILIIGAFTSSRSTLPCILLYHFTHF